MTRQDAISILDSETLNEGIGLGGYWASAAYKAAQHDIDAETPGLSRRLRAALHSAPNIQWDEIPGL